MAAKWFSRRSINRQTVTSTGPLTFTASSCRPVRRSFSLSPVIHRLRRFLWNLWMAFLLLFEIPVVSRVVSIWQNYMHRRERWYHQRDNNRLVRPFEWGLQYVFDHVNGDDPREMFRKHTAR